MTIRIDLSREEKARAYFDPLILLLLVEILLSAWVFTYYGRYLEQQIAALEREQQAVAEEIKQCETASVAIEQEQQKLRKLEQQFLLVQNLRHDPLKFANLLNEISRILPAEVSLESLAIEPAPPSVSFSALVKGPMPLALIARTMENFDRSAYFDTANLQSATRQGDEPDQMQFSMTVRFDPRAAVEKSPGSRDVNSKEVSLR